MLTFIFCFLLLSAGAAPADVPPAGKAAVVDTPGQLWAEATTLVVQSGKTQQAARLFLSLYNKFPDSPKAAQALLKAAELYKDQALNSRNPDWEHVRDLYRQFVVSFPNSAQVPDAYFEVGLAHYHMHFYPEASSYFKLFEKRFPSSPLITRVHYWQARTFYAVGRLDEAAKLFGQVATSAEKALSLKSMVWLGDIKASEKDYWGARVAYVKVMKEYPDYYLNHLELLVKIGKAYIKTDDEALGRKELFRYLNLAEQPTYKADVLLELGESFRRAGDKTTAQRLYAEALTQGTSDKRMAALVRFRQAEYRDFQVAEGEKWKKKSDLTDPVGDSPYLGVFEASPDDPVAQDARYRLMCRYLARKDFQQAFMIGKDYVRRTVGKDGRQKDVVALLGGILIHRMEELLQKKDYEAVYYLYRDEHNTVTACENGRLLFLVGQALEAMALYDQAAVVYYRALGLKLTDPEKADLYFRRAEVYLAKKDWASANRLLAYLQENYKGKPEAGEIYYLSGRLSEEQGKYTEALAYYDKVTPPIAYPARKPAYAQGRLRMLFALEEYDEFLEALGQYKQDGWLAGEDLQDWYTRLADSLRHHDDKQAAIKIYLSAVGKDMPQEREEAQRVHLYLGDLFRIIGDKEKSRTFFKKAVAGPNSLWSKVARTKLNDVDINVLTDEVATVLGN